MKEVEIWTDGASKGNPGPGGWGAWMKYKGHVLELCGGALSTTNNQMELTAPTEALCRLKVYEAAKPHDIEWVWVKGHDGIEGNERADFLANLGVEKTLEQSKKKN